MTPSQTSAAFRYSRMRQFLVMAMGFFLLAMAVPQKSYAVSKKKFDFVVGKDGDFKAAKSAAEKAGGSRFVMFFPDGEYNAGSLTGDGNQMTIFSAANVSFIGQNNLNTTIFNQSKSEGISITATLQLKGKGAYFQDITIKNKANYGNVASYSQTGRHVAMMEVADDIIYKNARLLSTQDTYYTKGKRTYWEGGEIHGTTDFICGKGDIYFNQVLLWVMKKSALAAPASNTTYGYVFDKCTIDGTQSGFVLARSWSAAKATFINTIMKKLPSAAAWGNNMNSAPVFFQEYNSVTADGSKVDVSKRRTDFDGTKLKTVISESEAANFSYAKVMGSWDPKKYTKQVAAPKVVKQGGKLTWNDDAEARCWAIFKNGKYIDNVITTSYDISSASASDVFTVRAANEMGGLGPANGDIGQGGKEYNLAISVSPSGSGTVSPAAGKISEGSVTMTATPAAGWVFDKWSGDLSGTSASATLNLNADKSVVANFVKDSRVFYNVTANATQGGTVSQSPEGKSIVEGSSVTITAIPNSGWKFDAWTGTNTGTDAKITIPSLKADVNITATFVPMDMKVYEAENGILKNAASESTNSGFSGSGYVNYAAAAGASIEIPVMTTTAGNTAIKITYANGSTDIRKLAISVNGKLILPSLDFPSTSNWTTWKEVQISVPMIEGANTIAFTTDVDGPNLDKIEIELPTTATHREWKKSGIPYSYNNTEKTLRIKADNLNNLKVSLHTLDGTQVLSRQIQHGSSDQIVAIQLNEFPPGVYLLKYEEKGKIWSGNIEIR